METKILKAVFGGGRYAVTTKRTRTDYGQVLEISGVDLPSTFECIFSNSATSSGVGKKQIGSAQRVLIPDEYLATGQTIYAWVLVHDSEDDGRHMYNVKIPVDDMPDLSPEEPTPVEQSVISQAITALNTAVGTTSQKAQEASDSADRAEQAAEGAEGYAERAEAAQSASEDARDIALEAKVSAQASAATASEKASEAISSATTASQSALTAETASENARASATASAESASQASASASTASTKAQEASGYASSANTDAQTASQKASEAAQSASSASQAKTDAETAKQASETAQGLAESARDDAITAKTSAESARDEAQSIADGITGKVEQIDSNTDRIESLEDDRYKPYAVDTASGAVASFSDGADNVPLKSCIVQVEPVQEGSGDPSPENVRPISGFTGVEVQRTGVNVWDEEWELGGYAGANGTPWEISDRIRSKTTNYIPIKPSTAYFNNCSYVVYFFYYDGSKVYLSYTNIQSKAVFTTPTNAYYMRFFVIPPYGTTYNHDISINYPSTDHDYHAYTGNSYNISWETEAGTVYGGILDVTTGELVVDRANIASYNGESLPSTWISDRDVYAQGATPTTGAQVVYKLAEPITYQLTPTELNSLLGTNNIWADTGDTEVEYRADTTLYISKKIAEALASLT